MMEPLTGDPNGHSPRTLMKPRLAALAWLALLPAVPVLADGPKDNLPDNVRRIPPPGVAIPDEVRAELTARAAALREAIDARATEWRQAMEKDKAAARRIDFLPDVEVFWKAVDWALRYDEFHDAKQTAWAGEQLAEGEARLASLAKNEFPWLAQTGLVVRGYRSRIDDSVQPFGLVVPSSFRPDSPHRWRLDVWFHGRGEKLSELDFIQGRRTKPGEFTPQDAIVLHPYGRYCNGQRFAGETDFFEALDTVQRDYRVDEDRIVVRGFSLGGAACWHIAAHHAWRWRAAAPGAGFSETEEFLNFFQGETLQPSGWERKLWNLHDTPAVAANFHNLPLVAYSGEIDKQKQAADAMAKALEKEGIALTHLIGPQTAHSYESGAKAELNRRIDALVEGQPFPRTAETLTTWTLKYNRSAYLTIQGLQEHWKAAKATLATAPSPALTVENIAAIEVRLPRHLVGGATPVGLTVQEAGGEASTPFPLTLGSDGWASVQLHREGGVWKTGPLPEEGLRKKPSLQGPIDDAFMDRFLFVRPTGQTANEKAGAWAVAELERAIEHWRRHYRGDVRVKDDTQVTEDDYRDSHLILWGDPSSNVLLAKIADQLPIRWTAGEIKAGEESFPTSHHALAAIHPNPLNPEKYVVINSSFTFRDYDYLNNARQTPKLPDWAIFDLDTPPNSRFAGKIVAAGFFGEGWEWKGREE